MADRDPFILKLNISHYKEMLKLNMVESSRSTIEQLLLEEKRKLANVEGRKPAD